MPLLPLTVMVALARLPAQLAVARYWMVPWSRNVPPPPEQAEAARDRTAVPRSDRIHFRMRQALSSTDVDRVQPVPSNEVAVTGRCETHPGRAAVGRCESCGRLLCIGCAVPVRGQTLGPECVGEVLGPDALQEVAPQERPRRPGMALAGFGFVAALLASVLPWSNRFSSHETGLFGGWGVSPLAWSLVAAVAAVGGTAAWAVARFTGRGGRMRRWAMVALAMLVVVGA